MFGKILFIMKRLHHYQNISIGPSICFCDSKNRPIKAQTAKGVANCISCISIN